MYSDYLGELKRLHSEQDYFYHELLYNAYLELCHDGRFIYRKFEFLESSGAWRARNFNPPTKAQFRAASSIAIGHSDKGPTLKQVVAMKLSNPFLRVWSSNFSVPSVTKILGLSPMPLGISNPVSESVHHEIAGNLTQLQSEFSKRREPKWELYANFRTDTNPSARLELWKQCERSNRITTGAYEISSSGRQADLSNIRNFGLVVCPEGNGKDTHRLWEVLYLGSIPVVLKNSYQHSLLSRLRLPVIGIKAWSHLETIDLGRAVSEVKSSLQAKHVRALRGSFWVKRISMLRTI